MMIRGDGSEHDGATGVALTVGQVAALFGVHASTIVSWEAQGRLPTAGRTPGGHRRYQWADIAPLVDADGPRSAKQPSPGRSSFADRYATSDLEDLYVRQGLSTYAIAARLGVHQRTVWKSLRDAGITRRSVGFRHPPRWPERIPRDSLEDLYVGQQLSMAQIAARLGVKASSVGVALRAYGIPTEGPRHLNRRRPDPDVLADLYVRQELSAPEIARRYGVHPHTPWRWLDAAGIPRRRRGPRPAGPAVDRDTLEDLYLRQGLSITAIAARLGRSTNAVVVALDRHGVPRWRRGRPVAPPRQRIGG